MTSMSGSSILQRFGTQLVFSGLLRKGFKTRCTHTQPTHSHKSNKTAPVTVSTECHSPCTSTWSESRVHVSLLHVRTLSYLESGVRLCPLLHSFAPSLLHSFAPSLLHSLLHPPTLTVVDSCPGGAHRKIIMHAQARTAAAMRFEQNWAKARTGPSTSACSAQASARLRATHMQMS